MFRYLIASAALLASSPLIAHETGGENVAAVMAKSANLFLSSLSEEQRNRATFKAGDEHREKWYFIPDKFIKPGGTRKGLKIKEMTPQQRLLTHALLSTAMSNKGYRQATTIMTLESILHELENKNPIRDSELYYVSIFGKPGPKNTWAWRFEGHHLSINISIVKGKMFSVTPSFFGTNPGRTEEGAFKGLEVLEDEQELAFSLVKSLTAEQLKQAMISAKAPADIITKQQSKADRKTFLPARGVTFDKLNAEQQTMLLRLLTHYASKYRPEIVDEINSRKPVHGGKKLHFAWAGGHNRNEGHYYRIQTKDFLFEYDNTQNGANHIHAVWRDFDGDFGRDLLKEHHAEKH